MVRSSPSEELTVSKVEKYTYRVGRVGEELVSAEVSVRGSFLLKEAVTALEVVLALLVEQWASKVALQLQHRQKKIEWLQLLVDPQGLQPVVLQSLCHW